MNVMPNYLSPTPHPLSPAPFQRGETSIISSSNATRVAAPDVVVEPSDDMMPADLDWEVCTLCDAFGRPGRLALATAVCDTCGYDPYGYYDDQPFEVLR